MGSDRYCMAFSGTGDGEKFLVKDTAAGTCAPCRGVGVLVGGFCWYLGVAGDSCDTTCSGIGLTCDVAGTVNYAGSSGTSAQCDAVLDALLGPGNVDTIPGGGLGCHNAINGRHFENGSTTTCAEDPVAAERACACQ